MWFEYMKEINLIDNSFDNLRKGTRYNRAPTGGGLRNRKPKLIEC